MGEDYGCDVGMVGPDVDESNTGVVDNDNGVAAVLCDMEYKSVREIIYKLLEYFFYPVRSTGILGYIP